MQRARGVRMTGEVPDALSFHPSVIHHWDGGYIGIGIDGELVKLSSDLVVEGPVVKPFPTPIHSSTVLGEQLILTWVDHELLLARMSSIDLDSKLQNGPDRGELRTRREVNVALHPAGTVWSHVLDSEPLSLTSNNEFFTFVLWRKGIYCMGMDAGEHWRKEEPNWPELGRLPSAQTVVASALQNDELTVWSRGGGFASYDVKTGELRSAGVIGFQGILQQVYCTAKHQLLCYESGDVLWVEDGIHRVQQRFKGPVQHALWNEGKDGWNIAGWREEAMLTKDNCLQRTLDEIPVQVLEHKGKRLLVLNNGTFIESNLS